DVIEQELREQIREIDQAKASMEVISHAMPIPGMDAMANLFTVMRHKLQEKLDHLHEFNQTSSNNYSTAIQLAASIATGLAEVQSGKGFSPASGTFSTQGLNMEWTTSIQAIEEDRKRQADNLLNGSSIEEGAMCGPLNSEKKDESLLDKFKHGVEDIYESAWDFIQGAGSAVAEDYIGLTPPDDDKLESNATYQAGRFTGHVLSTVGSIVEIFEGISVIGGANFLTFVAEVGSGGLVSPIVLPLDAVATAAGLGAVGHGGFVLNKSIQNAQDTLQKFESSSSSGGGKGVSKAAKPEKVINDLHDYTSKKWNVDGNKIMFDKKGMKHVLERHHPDYWDGSVKKEQSFLNKDLSISDIQNIAGEIISKNRDIIISKGTKGMYQIEGKVDGITYIVGFKNGRIGQLYPK
ncbi:hypothetical protein COF81_28335, partial [Bacillus pseudomycoides]